MSWTAGWNMPGYLPDADNVAEFDDRADAHAYLLAAVERFWDEDYEAMTPGEADGRWLPVHTALHLDSSGEFQGRTGDGSLVFWITKEA